MAQKLSKAQVRVLSKIDRGERLLAAETRTVGALERGGYVACDGPWRATPEGKAFLEGRS